MNCRSCGHENPAINRFCGRCGATLARVLMKTGAEPATAESEEALRRCLELIDATGARSYVPFVHEVRAALARRRGDEEAWLRELRQAHGLFTEMGATGHAERIGHQLSAVSRRPEER